MQINQIPIINYHKISPSYDIGITTRHPRRFEKDLEILKKHQFTAITFRDLIHSKRNVSNPIIITFDDAYESIKIHALPIMNAYGFKGIVYPVTNYIGMYNEWDVQVGKYKFKHLNWQELNDFRDLEFEIGSHTQTHELLTKMDYEQQLNELNQSKKVLEDGLGCEVYSISYPFGRFNQDTIRCVGETGYNFGLASLYFKNIEKNISNYVLKRFNIYRFDTDEQFERKIGIRNNNYIFYRDWMIQKGGLGTALLQSIRKHLYSDRRLKAELR
ncbi:MAG: polysaccharide deacetylase family protein [Calditrichaceae bacterium]|jgi:peptidoglycan/xylan/chitin deacetylase (PgdA/CDA1 family)